MPTIKSLQFIDSFDHYLSTQAGLKWTSAAAPLALSRVTGRNGYGMSGTNGTLLKTHPNFVRDICLGVAYNTAAFSGSPLQVKGDPNITLASLNHLGDGRFSVSTYGPVSSPVSTIYTSPAIHLNTWYYLELKVVVGNGSITFTVYLNGVQVATDTLSYGSSYTFTGNISGFAIGFPTGGNRAIIDDFYADSAGNQLGDTKVLCIRPNGDVGGASGWTPSTGSTHYTLIDDDTPDTTDYLSASTTALDQHEYEDISLTGSIYAVQFLSYTKKTDSGVAEYKHRYNSTDLANTFAPSASDYAYFIECYNDLPNAPGSEWTVAIVNAMQFGVNRTA